jgi:hypothetical protein
MRWRCALNSEVKAMSKIPKLILAFWFGGPLAAFAGGVLTNVPVLGMSLILGLNGSVTSAPAEVVAGAGSIKGSFSGTSLNNTYLDTNPSVVPLAPGQTYTATFRYKILTTPDKGFETLFYSPTGGNAGVWLAGSTINGVAGETGTVTFTNTLGPYSDYRLHWNVVGNGAISIDDIRVTNVSTGQTVVQEGLEQTIPTYVFANARTAYLLNLAATATDVVDKQDGSHTPVPFGQRMTFAGSVKYSKNSSYIVHHIRSHAETYIDWSSIADLPVDFLRTGGDFNFGPDSTSGRQYPATTAKARFPDRADKAIVGYVASMEFGPGDMAFDPSWDTDGDRLIDPGVTNLPSYVDLKVYNPTWRGYVAAYWTDSWRAHIQKSLDVLAVEHFDGVMFDVMTSYWYWLQAYPALDVNTLRQQYVDLLKWSSDYAKATYGSAFLITVNLDPAVKDYFPDFGRYIDAGYYQNAFFRWDGSGVIDGYGQSISRSGFSNPPIDFIRNQGLSVLDMDHLGTGTTSSVVTFTNYDDRIATATLLKLFDWAVRSGSTPYSTTLYMDIVPYTHGFPRFVRMLPGLPSYANTPQNNWVIGSEQADAITTGAGDDLIYGGPGDDVIDGGAGMNTAYYLGPRSNFNITNSAGTLTVTDTTGAEGKDTLKNIQRLQFADQVVDVGTVLTTSQLDCLFNWAERTYPAYFSPPGASSATSGPYYFRRYSGTGNYLANSAADNSIYVLGPAFGSSPLNVGSASSFLSGAGCQ